MNTEFDEKRQLHKKLGDEILYLTFDLYKSEEMGNFNNASLIKQKRDKLIQEYVDLKHWLYQNANDSHF